MSTDLVQTDETAREGTVGSVTIAAADVWDGRTIRIREHTHVVRLACGLDENAPVAVVGAFEE